MNCKCDDSFGYGKLEGTLFIERTDSDFAGEDLLVVT